MKKRNLYIVTVSLMLIMLLTACSNNTSEQKAEVQIAEDTVETQTAEDTTETQMAEDAAKIQTGEYSVNRTSVDNSDGTGAGYEIDDMLPRPSDDTFIMSVEDALELMNKNVDGTEQVVDEQQ